MTHCLTMIAYIATSAATGGHASKVQDDHHQVDTSESLLWDNGDHDGEGLVASQIDMVYGWDAQAADDFLLPTLIANDTDACWEITRIEWTGDYWNGDPAPLDFRIIIYDDDGSGNSPTYGPRYPITLARYVRSIAHGDTNETWNPTYERFDYSAEIYPPFALPGGAKYWIVFEVNYYWPPQWGIATAPIKLHPAKQGFPYLGVPYWENREADLSFRLFGAAAPSCIQPMTPGLLVWCDSATGTERFASSNLTYLAHFSPPDFEQGGLGPATYGPDGNIYRARDWGGEVLRFDGATGRNLGVFGDSGDCERPVDIIFGPDGNMYIGNLNYSLVCRVDGSTGAYLGVWTETDTYGRGLQFGPDGHLYVAEAETIRRYDGQTGQFLNVVTDNVTTPRALQFSDDGLLFVIDSADGLVKVIDPETGALLRTINPDSPLTYPRDLAFGTHGELFVTEAETKTVTAFDIESGAIIASQTLHQFVQMLGPRSMALMISPGDLNQNHTVDLRDFAAFENCFTGEPGTVTTHCRAADVDDDGDADGRDYQYLLVNLSGPGN